MAATRGGCVSQGAGLEAEAAVELALLESFIGRLVNLSQFFPELRLAALGGGVCSYAGTVAAVGGIEASAGREGAA